MPSLINKPLCTAHRDRRMSFGKTQLENPAAYRWSRWKFKNPCRFFRQGICEASRARLLLTAYLSMVYLPDNNKPPNRRQTPALCRCNPPPWIHTGIASNESWPGPVIVRYCTASLPLAKRSKSPKPLPIPGTANEMQSYVKRVDVPRLWQSLQLPPV